MARRPGSGLRDAHSHLWAKLQPEPSPERFTEARQRVETAEALISRGLCPNGCGALAEASCAGCGFHLRVVVQPTVPEPPGGGFWRQPNRSQRRKVEVEAVP